MHPGLPPVDRGRPDAGLGVSPDRAVGPLVSVRERDRRREGRAVQLPGDRAVLAVRGAGPRGHDHEIRAIRTRLAGSRRAIRFAISRSWSSAIARSTSKGLPRFAGGAVGYAAYDAVRYTENLPNAPPDDRGLPDLSFAFYDRMVHLRPHSQDDPGRGAGARGTGHRSAGGLRGGLRPGRRAGRRDWPRPAPSWACSDIDTDSPVTLQPRSNFTRERLRGGRPPLPGVHQGRRHLSGRPQPAVRDRDARPSRSTSTGCCAWSIPARSCFTCPTATSP